MQKKLKKIAKSISRKNLRVHILSIAILAIFCLLVVVPTGINKGINWVNNKSNIGIPGLPNKGFNLGLDLQGGAHLVYQADTSLITKNSEIADAVEGVRDVIERRVRGGLGVSEPVVQTTKVGSDYRVIIELPGVKDVNKAITMIGETPTLEFKEENTAPARALTPDETKQMNDYNQKASEKANTAIKELKSDGSNFSELVRKYSEDHETIVKNNGELGYLDNKVYPEFYNWANSVKDNDVSKQVLALKGSLNILKRISSQPGQEEVNASHILICYEGSTRCDNPKYKTKEEAKKKIDEIKKEATADNFASLAKQYSTEEVVSESGGSLGWFPKGAMVKSFEDKAFSMTTGTISEVFESEFGYHILYKKDVRRLPEFKIARIFINTKTAEDIVPPAENWKGTGLSGKQLKRAEVMSDPQTSQIQVNLSFDSDGAKMFADITEKNIGKQVAIFLDGEPISIPTVNERIGGGQAVITGKFSLNEAQLLTRRLNSGALPVPIELISQQTVDATLGADSIRSSYQAALFGLILVIIFMIIYYRLPGIISALALAIYGLIAMAIFKLIGVTLTLSGIAGFILSLGMAVDANVLIFERLKEELQTGRSLRPAIEDAFKRAWTSIRDGNITTLISAVFLIWFGTGFVQGFAVTLAIGVVSSMFTAIIITRAIMRFISYWFKRDGNKMFLGYKEQSDK